jgi:hypothetical protein
MGANALQASGSPMPFKLPPPAIFVLSLFAVFSSFLCSGCLVFPAGKANPPIGASGALSAKVDLTFIHPGTTQRAEVIEKLKLLDSGCGNTQSFWGRWSTPSADIVWIHPSDPALRPSDSHGYSIHNILVEFDNQGAVQSSRLVSDDHIIPELRAFQVKTHTLPLDLSEPISFFVEYTPWNKWIISASAQSGTIVLFKDFFQFLEERSGKHSFTVPRSTLVEISHNHYGSDNANPGLIFVTLHFNKTTPAGRDLHISLELHDLMALLEFASQS